MSTVPFFRLIILHFILFSCSCALRWPFQPSSRASKRIPELAASQELKVDDLTMTDVEKRMLFRSIDTLSSYKTGSGCFYDASMDLSKRCDELESNQEGRVLAAIRFTLCELETADFLKPPAECEQYIRRDTRGLSHCVEALHRSPQFWSSYSGYLREIPQLCTAYRRLHDIDTAKGLYHNATQEKIYLLHLLQQRELIYQEQQRQLIANLNNLGEVETKLKQSATMFGIKGDTVLSNFETMLHQAKRHVFDLHSQLSTTITEQTRIHGDQLSRLVRRTENEHEAVLHTLLHDTSTAIGTIVKALHDISDKSDMLALSMETTQGEWRKLDESTMTLGNVIVSLTTTVEQVSHDLERQSVMVHEMTVHQENFSKYMHGIEMAMSQMMTVIYGHIENVTHASTAAQLRLSQNKHGGLNLRLVLEAAQLIWMSDWTPQTMLLPIWHAARASVLLAGSIFSSIWLTLSIVRRVVIVFRKCISRLRALPKSRSFPAQLMENSVDQSKIRRVAFLPLVERRRRELPVVHGIKSNRRLSRAISEPPPKSSSLTR